MDSQTHQDHDFTMHRNANSGMWVGDEMPYSLNHHVAAGHEYNDFTFMNMNTMSMQPPYSPQAMAPPPTTQPQLPPLVTTPWPSLLQSRSNYNAPVYSPPIATTSVMTPMSAPSMMPARTYVRERRTLTDEQRRKMCQYAADNPNVKQTEIGGLFGVERSTVSKVLRQKEKYLAQDNAAKVHGNPSKRMPDIERAVRNWVKNERREHRTITDDQLREKFQHFSKAAAQASGDSTEEQCMIDDSFLEAFKHKNALSSKRRNGSIMSEMDVKASTEKLSDDITPSSPHLKREASPLEASSNDERQSTKKVRSESPSSLMEDTTHVHRSYASIGSALDDSVHVTFLPEATSPSNLFSSSDPFSTSGQQIECISSAQTPVDSSQRHGRQSFPISLSTDSTNSYRPTISSDAFDAQATLSDFMSSGPSQLFDSTTDSERAQISQLPTSCSTIDSSTFLAGPTSMTSPTLEFAQIPLPASPSLDETKRAFGIVWSFFRNQSLDAQEQAVMESLMDKLELKTTHLSDVARGLHTIEEA